MAKTKEQTDEIELFDLSSVVDIARPTRASNKTSMLLYARHRVGKSYLAATAQDVEGMSPLLWIAAEDGTGAFADKYPDIDVVHCSTWNEIQHVVTQVLENKTKYKTVVLDTLGQVQEIIKRDYLKSNGGKGDFEMWAKIADGIVWILDSFQNPLAYDYESYNFIAIAHTEKVKDDTLGQVMLSPYFLGKKSVVDIPKIPDTIAYLAKVTGEDGETVRVLQLTSTDRIDAGSRYEHKLPNQLINPTMQDIYSAITAE